MPTEIKCPNCNHAFPIEEVMAEEYKKELREQMASFKKKQQEDFDKKTQALELQKKQQEESFETQRKQQELAFEQRLAKEKEALQAAVSENLRKSISADFENRLKMADESNKENEEKLKAARQKELEYLQMANEMKRKEEEMELSIQKKIAEEREKMAVDIRTIENQRLAQAELDFKMKLAEKDKQLEDQKKLAEEMKRKAEQGSMQLQGEIQELALEELLRSSFPFDLVQEVGKGVRGADCIQTVRNNFGQECGRIIYESKRTVAFANDWIEKLKTDMRSQGAEIAVLVTQNMPKDMNCFGLKDGVWICTFNEVQALSAVLRDGILRLFNAAKSQDNKGDNTVAFEIMELEKITKIVETTSEVTEAEEELFVEETDAEDVDVPLIETQKMTTTTEVEEINVVTKLSMPSRKLKVKISNELLFELEKRQINFKLN